MTLFHDDTVRALQLLSDYGDPVEQRILLRQEELSIVIEPYATIWSEHVYPRRDEQQQWRVADAWMPFAGSHYTAFIRTFQALENLDRIVATCESFDADRYDAEAVLNLHDATEAFWQRIDQVIDHLGFAFDDAPFPNKSDSANKLNGKWDRSRSDERDTLLTFYGRIPAMVEKQLYRTQYPRKWASFLSDISAVWWELQSWLRTHDSPPTKLQQLKETLDDRKQSRVTTSSQQ